MQGLILTVVHWSQASKNTNGPLSVSVASPGGQWTLSVKVPCKILYNRKVKIELCYGLLVLVKFAFGSEKG